MVEVTNLKQVDKNLREILLTPYWILEANGLHDKVASEPRIKRNVL